MDTGTTTISRDITIEVSSSVVGRFACSDAHSQAQPPVWAFRPTTAAMKPRPMPSVAVVAGA